MPPKLLERPQPALRPGWPRLALWCAAGAAALVLGTLGLRPLVSVPSTVKAVTFTNDTPFTVNLDVTSGSHQGWLQVATAERKSEILVEDVLDQGDSWRFHAYGQGADGGEFTLTRAELEAGGWHVAIPADVANRLAAAGAPPTP